MAYFVQNIANFNIYLILFFFLLLFLIERLAFAQLNPLSKSSRKQRIISNIGLGCINAFMSLIIIVPLSYMAWEHSFNWRPDNIIIDILILDIAIYIWHRLNHKIPFLWRWHRVHHLDQFLDTTSAIRFHFCEVFLSALFRAPIIIFLDINWVSVILFETLITLCTFFHHSNIKLQKNVESFLSYFIVTPSIHWVHHHNKQSDTDSNYAVLLSFWDRLFHTHSTTERFKNMPLGLKNRNGQSLPDKALTRLILNPFKRS